MEFSVMARPKPHWFPAVFLAGSYALLCTLVIAAVQVAAGKDVTSTPVPGSPLLPWQALSFLIAGALVAGLIIRKVKARMAWELMLGATLFLGVWFYLWATFSGEFGLVTASLMTLLQAFVRRVWIHNVFILLGTAGVALNFAFLFPIHTILVLLVGLAIYDNFAGRPEGLAARFAASLVHRGLIPGLIIPAQGRDFFAPIAEAIKKSEAVFLGAGDLILPVMLVARAAGAGIVPAVTVTVGILIAVAWLGSRGPTRPFPALVPLAAGAGIPYLLLMLTHFV